jgi:hypothetical protein
MRIEPRWIPLSRLAGWTVLASAVISAVAIALLIAMFVSFASGATAQGRAFGRMNDIWGAFWYLLLVPTIVVLHGLLRRHHPGQSRVALVLGITASAAIVVLQALLVAEVLTFEQQIGPVSIAMVALGVWFVWIGRLGSAGGTFSNGVRLGLLAAIYVGYPIWAAWMSRHLLRLAGRPERSSGVAIDSSPYPGAR